MAWVSLIAKKDFGTEVVKEVDLGYLVQSNNPFEVIVTPKVSSNRIVLDANEIRVYVTTVPGGGKATAVAIKLLSKAIGAPKSKLKLLLGATSKRKVFR